MSESSAPIVIGIGEFLFDEFPDGRRPGGAPANVAFHANQLGLRGRLCTRVGRDEDGTSLLAHLAQHGVSTALVQHDDAHPTGTVTVHLETSEGPAYTIHENVAWDHLAYSDALAAACTEAQAVCFGTLAQRSPESRRTIGLALDVAASALKVYDVNLRPPHYTPEIIADSLRHCQVVKLNIDEVGELSAMLDLGSPTPEAFGAHVCRTFDVDLVCITRGGDGCLLVGDTTVDLPGAPVQVVDAVGAGDAFTAALTCALLDGWPLARVAAFANQFGGLVASRAGAMPHLAEEAGQLMTAARA